MKMCKQPKSGRNLFEALIFFVLFQKYFVIFVVFSIVVY